MAKQVQVDTDRTPLPGNVDFEWDVFDSKAYFEHNYGELHREDDEIIQIVADHFAKRLAGRFRTRAIDVGAGANLYPAMTMLPFAAEVVLYERASTNREWLASELQQPSASWEKFWAAVSGGRAEYRNITKPMELLRQRAVVQRGNVFALEPNQYDLGTMFFVAESITNRDDEFRRAARLFIDSLVPKAPFAAAFMRDSSGYIVDGRSFPACSVTEKDVVKCLADIAFLDKVQVINSQDLREGYCGMIVATGFKR